MLLIIIESLIPGTCADISIVFVIRLVILYDLHVSSSSRTSITFNYTSQLVEGGAGFMTIIGPVILKTDRIIFFLQLLLIYM